MPHDPASSKAAAPWALAKGWLAQKWTGLRRSKAATLLAGKVIWEIQEAEGLAHGWNLNSPCGQLGHTGETFGKLCRERLGIAGRTARRYVKDYKDAKAAAKQVPLALAILETPSAELGEEALEVLAACIEKLTPEINRHRLEIELGVALEDESDAADGDSGEESPFDEKEERQRQASAVFRDVYNRVKEIDKIAAGALDSRHRLKDLPKAHPDPTAVIGLLDLKFRLEEVLGGELFKLLEEVNAVLAQPGKNGERTKAARSRKTKAKEVRR